MRNISKFLILIILPLLIFNSCSSNPGEVVNKYAAAFNSHDTQSLLTLFNKDAVIEISFTDKIEGINKIKDYVEFNNALNSEISVGKILNSNGEALFVMGLRNDLLRTIGIDTAKYSMIFTVNDGIIVKITCSTTNETNKKIEEFKNKFMLWAAREKPGILNEIMPNGKLIYNAQNAKKYFQLILNWKMNAQTSVFLQ